MTHTLKSLLLFTLLWTTACRTGISSSNGATGLSRATPQIVIGFATPAGEPSLRATRTRTPPATPIVVTAAVTQTVIVKETVIPPTPPPVVITTTPIFPTLAPTSTPPPAAGVNCDNPLAIITSPPMNATIRGTVPFTGTANTADFLFYKLQYMPDASWGSERWGELYQSADRVVNGKLMEWQTRTVEPGVYWLRLLVTRSNGQYGLPCTIRVVVVR